MPGEAAGNATRGGHYKYIGIAIVLGAEGNALPVGRKHRVAFGAGIHGQAARVAAIAVGHPQVFGINKGNVLLADGGLPEQPCVGGINGMGMPGGAAPKRDGEQRSIQFFHDDDLKMANSTEPLFGRVPFKDSGAAL
jgi:hypothetical protein